MNALIFGITGGIGSALAKRLLHAGHRVFGSARNPEKLSAIANELGVAAASGDVTQPADVQHIVEAAAAHMGGLDAVALCVGSILLKPAHLTTDDEWASTLNLNLNSAFFVTRACAKAMQANGGAVVLVSTCAARIGLPNHEAIAAAKAGVEGLARSAAATYAGRRLRFNVVAPGLVDTPLSARITANDAALKASQAMHPIGRIGKPDDVASAIAWLLDPEQSWVTGQVIGIDGGLATLKGR